MLDQSIRIKTVDDEIHLLDLLLGKEMFQQFGGELVIKLVWRGRVSRVSSRKILI